MANKWILEHQIRNENIAKELEPIYAKANCRGKRSELFFPPIGKGTMSVKPGSLLHEAFTICNECDVKKECLEFALAHDCVGVWGGKYISFAGVSPIKLKE